MRDRIDALKLLAGLAWQADRRRVLAGIALTLLGSALVPLFGLWMKLLADGASDGDRTKVVLAAAALGAGWLLGSGAGNLSWWTLGGLIERIGLLFNERLIELTTAPPGIEHLERSDYHDRIALVQDAESDIAAHAMYVGAGLTYPPQLAISAVLLASVSPLLLLLPVVAIPSFLLASAAERIDERSRERTAVDKRRADHVYELATSIEAAKEIRIAGLGRELVARHRRLSDDVRRERVRASLKSGALMSIGFALFALGYVGALALVAWRATHGDASVGDVLLALTVAGQLNEQIGANVWWLTRVSSVTEMLKNYRWLIDYAEAARRAARGRSAPPERLERGIDLEGVAFRYPGTETPVLRDVDLHLPAGSTVAIVGENGAGKTTLVKLLCRFYEPTSGRIRIDGVDLAEIDPERWRRHVSGAFQDFVRFELLARETVGVGELTRIEDEPTVGAALERASAGDVLATLPRGLATQLGTAYADGHELSGGQWQKLAVARGMMREAPLLLVLDEPTANLDAHTEHVLFERYAHGAQRVGAAAGAITVLVSHRFSTVRMADLILVIADGRIHERGSHAELLALGGLYHDLFHLQADAYRAE